MPPPNVAINLPQPTNGSILNHRRKQFRNIPAGSKLEHLQHHRAGGNSNQGVVEQQPNNNNPNRNSFIFSQ